VKREPPITVFQPTLKLVKALGKNDGLIFSLDRRSILDIVNRKAKKPAGKGRRPEK
jgi:hypothetical protein